MLVNQSLDPLVSAYFKDVAQTKTLIELIQERSAIRERAVEEMRDKLSDAIKNSKVDIVPKTMVNMGSSGSNDNGNNSTIMDTLLKFITMEKLGVSFDSHEKEMVESKGTVVSTDSAQNKDFVGEPVIEEVDNAF
ncbi:MAG: hypothetical protein ACERKZ_11870 [Lachnotalea sp.]